MRILLAEDQPILQRVASKLLKRLGHTIETAGSGHEVLAQLERTPLPFDAILMDVQMPGMDGIETTRHICAAYPDPAQRPPILAVSAKSDDGDREACLEAGMQGILGKPLRMDALEEALERIKAGRAPGRVTDPVLPAIDFQQFDSFMASGGEESREIFLEFCEFVEEMLADMDNALRAGHAARVRKVAHQLKGSFATFGLAAVSRQVAAIEDSCIAGSPDPVEAGWYASVRDDVTDGMRQLKARLQANG